MHIKVYNHFILQIKSFIDRYSRILKNIIIQNKQAFLGGFDDFKMVDQLEMGFFKVFFLAGVDFSYLQISCEF